MTPDTERREHRNAPALLAELRRERFTGAVDVEGGPGGTLFLRDGLVGAVESPAAPSARSLLLKSGRVEEDDWEAALATPLSPRASTSPACTASPRPRSTTC